MLICSMGWREGFGYGFPYLCVPGLVWSCLGLWLGLLYVVHMCIPCYCYYIRLITLINFACGLVGFLRIPPTKEYIRNMYKLLAGKHPPRIAMWQNRLMYRDCCWLLLVVIAKYSFRILALCRRICSVITRDSLHIYSRDHVHFPSKKYRLKSSASLYIDK